MLILATLYLSLRSQYASGFTAYENLVNCMLVQDDFWVYSIANNHLLKHVASAITPKTVSTISQHACDVMMNNSRASSLRMLYERSSVAVSFDEL